uniref:Uncharacterized protein AlNc14C346G10862 n=1 Tax=Albugo laibachii Nc14 TaxID=890382 RepID=F0WXA9_9STRA|nr:conserved hypothetical protein [Albugo laibachii Nc14]|eukprot:CCA26101.1 conserved hypothetical protein [Albugo laibachii Nc14]
MSKLGSVSLAVMTIEKEQTVELTDVYYAKRLTHNLLSYGILDRKGSNIAKLGSQHVLQTNDENNLVFDVGLMNNVLVVSAKMKRVFSSVQETIMAAIGKDREGESARESVIQQGSLMDFHRRLGHLNYDKRVAKDRDSGIFQEHLVQKLFDMFPRQAEQ